MPELSSLQFPVINAILFRPENFTAQCQIIRDALHCCFWWCKY